MTSANKSRNMVYASTEAVHGLAHRLLLAHDVLAEDTRIVSDCLDGRSPRGGHTHGIVRFPGYLARVRQGLINPRPNIEIKQVTPVVAGENGPLFRLTVG